MAVKTSRIKLSLLWYHGRRCAICGKKINHFEELSVDHIIPLGKGGKNTIENCQLAHVACNCRKANNMPDEYDRLLRYNKRRIIRMRIRHLILFWR